MHLCVIHQRAHFCREGSSHSMRMYLWQALDAEEQVTLSSLVVRYTSRPSRMSEDGCTALEGESNVRNGPGLEPDGRDRGGSGSEQTAHSQTTDEVQHPLFRQHPVSGRPALFVAPMFMASIDGLSRADAVEARVIRDSRLAAQVVAPIAVSMVPQRTIPPPGTALCCPSAISLC